jgi:hypothetical protein
MDTASRPGLTVRLIRAISNMVKSMVSVVSTGQMHPSTKEKLLIIKYMARVSTPGVMAECMRDSGVIIR